MPQGPSGGTLRRQAEREFYYRALGGSFPQQRIHQLARRFYILYLQQNGGAPANAQGIPLDQLEIVWLKTFVLKQGGTIPQGSGQNPNGFRADLWRAALVLTPQKAQVSKNLNDNRYTFFLNN